VKSYAQHWKDQVDAQLDGYRTVADAAATREGKLREFVSGGHLHDAFLLVYAGHHDLARTFFEIVVDDVEYSSSHENFEDEPESFPASRGTVLVYQATARGFLTGRTDAEAFLRASSDFENFTAGRRRFDWYDREYLLWSIRCALLAGDIERAGRLVEGHWTRIQRYEEGQILRKLSARDQGVLPALDDYFERAREPNAQLVTVSAINLALELAVLRAGLIDHETPPDWWAALARVGA